MKSAEGFVQAYNAQAGVEPEFQFIVGQTVTQAANDKEQLIPMMKTIEAQIGTATGRRSCRQRLLLGEESGTTGFGRQSGAAHRRLHRYGTAEAR